MIVDVAINRTKRIKCGELVCGFGIADIAGMPDFVNWFEEFENPGT
jgi:hypothetical protein